MGSLACVRETAAITPDEIAAYDVGQPRVRARDGSRSRAAEHHRHGRRQFFDVR